jgi:short chain dehydrogenase
MSRDPALAGQTVVVLGGTAGIGLETARHAHANGAELIVTARNHERLREVGRELEATIEAFDSHARDPARLEPQQAGAPVDKAGARRLWRRRLIVGAMSRSIVCWRRLVGSVWIAACMRRWSRSRPELRFVRRPCRLWAAWSASCRSLTAPGRCAGKC